MPILCQYDSSLSSSGTDDTISEKKKDEDSYEPIIGVLVNDILLGTIQNFKDPPQRNNRTTDSRSKHMDVNFTKNI